MLNHVKHIDLLGILHDSTEIPPTESNMLRGGWGSALTWMESNIFRGYFRIFVI